ncbi:MAG: response regulator [Pleomorphochaeta sp.]
MYENKRDYNLFPLAISVAKVDMNKIVHQIVSEQFCKEFNLNEKDAINKLNNENNKYLFSTDEFWINEKESQLINNIINEFNIIVRYINKENGSINLINISAKKHDENEIIYSYSNISKSIFQDEDFSSLMQKQQLMIADNSTNSVAILAKKDLSIVYLNKVARKVFKDIDLSKNKITCHQYFRNTNKICKGCPIINDNNENEFEVEKLGTKNIYKIKMSNVYWENKEAYIVYITDITEYKKDQHLFELYKSLIEYKQNSKVDIGSLFCFDVESKKIEFYYLNSTEIDFKNKTFDEIIEFYYPYIYGEENRKKFKAFFNFENILSDFNFNKTASIEYQQKINNNIQHFRSTYHFLVDPTTDKTLLIINVYDITNRLELEKMLNAIVSYQNEIVTRQDMSTKEMIVFARKENFLEFPIGFSRYSFKGFEDHVHKRMKVISTSGDKRLTKCIDREILVKNEAYSTTYELDINGEIRYKRSLGFRDDENSLFTVIYDVTDLSKEEKEKNEKLREINKQYAKAKQEAVKANKSKSDFLSRMSHDMRTPLGAIISLSSFGKEECKDSYFNNFYKLINENGQYLLSLVNDILDFQKIENDSIELNKKVNMFGNTAKSVESIIRPKANDKNIEFTFTKEQKISNQYVLLDEKRMKQLLINILTNSVKYTHPGGKIEWTMLIKEDEFNNPVVVHTIKDNGVGMSKKFQEHMYEPFFKEYNPLSDVEGGTGLGLAISKRLVDSMNGTIECNSDINQGTTFIITIPREIPTKAEIQKYLDDNNYSIQDVDFKGKKILICEDILINQIIVKKILEDKNAVVFVAKNGYEGLKLMKKVNFNAVLLDIRMPILNGIETAKEIRKKDKKIPIIALSANAFSDDINRSISAGMDAHIAKPIKKEELYFLLTKLL